MTPYQAVYVLMTNTRGHTIKQAGVFDNDSTREAIQCLMDFVTAPDSVLSPDDNPVKTGLSDRERRLMGAAYDAGRENGELHGEDVGLYSTFENWLGDVISDGGHTVEEYVSSTYWDKPLASLASRGNDSE